MASPVKNDSVGYLSSSESSMSAPTVSFVVLCYNLAHLLPECINSILSQTYRDFEVLVMDDCSPDNTPEVARSFDDPRVKHIRNEKNLGFLRNENEGVRLSRGKYVWIISADDYLRRPYVLQRYVELMEKHHRIGYVFCSGVRVRNGQEIGCLDYSVYRDQDEIVNGHRFLNKLLHGNIVLAASAMARRECYEKITLYPLEVVWGGVRIDMVWAADWYVWCLFAVWFDVAYFAEPMVCYREHDLSISSNITQQDTLNRCVTSDIAVPWLIRQKAEHLGLRKLSRDALRAVAHEYAWQGESKQYRESRSCMSVTDFEDSLCRSTESEKERNWIRGRFYAAKGNASFAKEEIAEARKLYLQSLQGDPLRLAVYAKLFLALGKHGIYLRRAVRQLREWSR